MVFILDLTGLALYLGRSMEVKGCVLGHVGLVLDLKGLGHWHWHCLGLGLGLGLGLES